MRDSIRISEDPEATPFPTRDRDDLIERYNIHRQWVIDSEGMAKKSIPDTFTDKMKWIDWKAVLIHFLKSQTGRNGVPLNYAVRDNVNPIVSNNPNFLDN